MEEEGIRSCATMPPEGEILQEGLMVHEDRWKEMRRLHVDERMAIAEIARRFELDRKTVRRCLKEEAWRPYQRAVREDTLLADHAGYVRERAPQVEYSAQVLYQELKKRGYAGSYETVKRFVRPLRAVEQLAERATVRFETPPGAQSQIDWGSARVQFRHQRVVLHLFILTLGYSRRGFYDAFLNEQLPQFLDAHERAFDHFGGHTREHLYDRPRTVCVGTAEGRPLWNTTFKSFADYWGFEPRLCRAYRAQTKGKVESGVKYVKRNFLVGRSFVDLVDVREQLGSWNQEIADVRIHGTTHERPIDRFQAEQPQLVPLTRRAGYRLEATYPRIVADDFLITLDTNRYSVPFQLIGQTVQVQRREGQVRISHRGQLIVSHEELTGRHQMRVLPEHGPGAVARNQRHRRSAVLGSRVRDPRSLDVEVRDLASYEALCTQGGEV
jgi:transposase